MHTYQHKVLADSFADPETFWSDKAKDIAWFKKPAKALSRDANGKWVWFKDGELNTAYNCLDRHIEADAAYKDHTAIIWDSPVSKTKEKISYGQLLERVKQLSALLRSYGVTRGDTVLIYMPMIPNALVAMLSCARLGAIHSVVFGGFASKELAKRIDDSKPKVIIGANCGIEPTRVIAYKPMIDAALEPIKHRPHRVLIYNRPHYAPASLNYERGDRDWDMEISRFSIVDAPPTPVKSQDPLYILYTSGTTGIPKGVVRTNGGHAVHLNYTMSAIYGAKKKDVMFCASDIGWVVGHSYIVYAPLLYGMTTILYEGKPIGTPDASAFFRVVAEYKANFLFTAPTAIRAIRREDPESKQALRHDFRKTLRALFLAGERTDPGTLSFVKHLVGKDATVVDNYWSTESGSPITAACQGLIAPSDAGKKYAQPHTKPGSAGIPNPGYNVQVLNDKGQPVEHGQMGNLVIQLPLPPSAFPTLWQNEEGYQKSYFKRFPGYFDTGDAGMLDDEGYVHVMSRTDDIINVAGHRLSTGSIEQILNNHPSIAECCVVPMKDSIKGHKPLGLVVTKQAANIQDERIQKELVQAVRDDLGAIACFDRVVIVSRLPKTRSGKVLRRCIRNMIDGDEVKVPATIEDESVIGEVSKALDKAGLLPTVPSKL